VRRRARGDRRSRARVARSTGVSPPTARYGAEDVQDERAFGTAVRRVLDPAGEDVALERAELVRLAVDDEGLHPAQDDAELLVLVTV